MANLWADVEARGSEHSTCSKRLRTITDQVKRLPLVARVVL